MKVYVLILLNIFLIVNSLSDNINDYDNAQKCVSVVPNKTKDCNDIPSDNTDHDPVKCCYVTYTSEAEESVQKCALSLLMIFIFCLLF